MFSFISIGLTPGELLLWWEFYGELSVEFEMFLYRSIAVGLLYLNSFEWNFVRLTIWPGKIIEVARKSNNWNGGSLGAPRQIWITRPFVVASDWNKNQSIALWTFYLRCFECYFTWLTVRPVIIFKVQVEGGTLDATERIEWEWLGRYQRNVLYFDIIG